MSDRVSGLFFNSDLSEAEKKKNHSKFNMAMQIDYCFLSEAIKKFRGEQKGQHLGAYQKMVFDEKFAALSESQKSKRC